MNMRKICAGIASTALVGSAFTMAAVAPAHADPAFTPNALDSANPDFVGGGSDTIERVVSDLANGVTVDGAAVPGFNAGKSGGRLASWDARNAAGQVDQIVAREGAAASTRPNGSGNGKKKLYLNGGEPAYNFARSSSGLSTDEINAGLQQLPFAVDGLRMAVSGNVPSNAPAGLTGQQILDIYKGNITNWKQVGGKDGVIKPYGIQAGSGTSDFFKAQLKALNNGTDPVYGPAYSDKDAQGVSVQEHDPSVVQNDPNAIVAFSTARAQTLPNKSAIRLLNDTKSGGWNAARAVYIVLRGADAAKPEFQAIFGESGFFCSDQGRKIIEHNGFAQLRTVANGGICGKASQSSPTSAQLTTNTVETQITVSGTSSAANSATLTATVTDGAQGEVEFYEGETLLGSAIPAAGTATKTVQGLTGGEHTFTAKFVSDNPAAATDATSAPATVKVLDAATTTLTVPASSPYGQNRNAVVKVTAENGVPTGNVTLSIGSWKSTKAVDANGAATIAIPNTLAAGTKSVVASYAGDATYAASTLTKSLVVAKAAVKVTETYAARVKAKAAAGKIRVALLPSSTVKPTGKVVIKRGAKVLTTKSLSSGQVSYRITGLVKGKNSITVSYKGSANTKAATLKFAITRR